MHNYGLVSLRHPSTSTTCNTGENIFIDVCILMGFKVHEEEGVGLMVLGRVNSGALVGGKILWRKFSDPRISGKTELLV